MVGHRRPLPFPDLSFDRVLLVHGLADDVVPAFRSDDAAAALKLAGVPVELVFIPRVGHTIDPAGVQAGAGMLQRCFGV